jgi:hypothetical protein
VPPAPSPFKLTHSRILKLPLEIEVKLSGAVVNAKYLAHGLYRTVYRLGNGFVLKIEEIHQGNNENEVKASKVLSPVDLMPRVVDSGTAKEWSRRDDRHIFVKDWSFIIVENVDKTLAALVEDAAMTFGLVLEAAQCLALCSTHGLLVSDNHFGNMGVVTRDARPRVVVLDIGSSTISTDECSKSTVNTRVMRRFWTNARKYVSDDIVDKVAHIWQSSWKMRSFIDHAHQQPPQQQTLSCPFDDSHDDIDMLASPDDTDTVVVRTGWYVDSLSFHVRGKTTNCGNILGGTVETKISLVQGEFLTKVHIDAQRGESGVVGRRVLLSTNKREFAFTGERTGKPRDYMEFEVDRSRGKAIGLQSNEEGRVCGWVYIPDKMPQRIKLVCAPLIVSDSTLGSSHAEQGPIIVPSGNNTRLLYHNGGCFSGIVSKMALDFTTDARRVFYVPMRNSLPHSQQIHYESHVVAQELVFKGVDLVRLPCIMDCEEEYAEISWEKYKDPSPTMYGTKRNLRLRPQALRYFLNQICSIVRPGDVVLAIGWNASNPTAEFEAQRDFGLQVLGLR